MVFLGFSMEHQGLSIGHHRFSMAHHGCDPVRHGTPWGFHRFPWYFHGSPWGIAGNMGHHGLSIAMLHPCPCKSTHAFCRVGLIASTFKYDFCVPVYSSSTSSLLVNSISMSLVLKWEGKELSNKRNKLEALRERRPLWPRQIITPILSTVKNVEPWLWKTTHPPKKKKKKKKKKVLDHYRQHDLGMLPLLRCFFAHLLILQYPDHHQNLISSYLYYSGPVHKISSQSVHNFLSNVVHRQTKQTDRQNQHYQKHNLLCQGGN